MISAWNTELFRWLNSWVGVSSFFDGAIVFLAVYFWYAVLVSLFIFAAATFFPRFRALRRQNTELVAFALFSALVARFGIAELVRFFYNRPRPFEIIDEVRQLVEHPVGGSFPSGHASLAFAVAAAASFYYPRMSILFYLAAISIGFGRIAAGVHWPSDILGGAVVGVGTAYLLSFCFRRKG